MARSRDWIKMFVINRNQPAPSDDMMLTRRWLRSSSRSSSRLGGSVQKKTFFLYTTPYRDAVQSRCFEPWPDVTGNFRNFLENFLVLVGFLLASFDRGLLQWCVLVKQSVEVDCEDHVVPPVKFLEPYDSNQSAASLTLHEHGERRHGVHVQLTSGTSSSNREEERPPEPITGFGSRAGTTNCDASGLGGFVRRYLSTRNLRITSNFFRSTNVPCVTLCTLSLSCQTTLTKRKKKKKKRLSDVSVPQSWSRWAHSVSHTRVTVERGIKFGIDQNRDAAANCWRLAPWLMPAARRRHPRFFGHFWPPVWPSSRSNFDLGPSPLDSTEKNLSYQSLWFWTAVFL